MAGQRDSPRLLANATALRLGQRRQHRNNRVGVVCDQNSGTFW
jgi:hypothetical protein